MILLTDFVANLIVHFLFLPAVFKLFLLETASLCVQGSTQQVRRIVDETSELVGQVPVVFGQKAAHFYPQQFFGNILHDGSYGGRTRRH